MSKSTIDLRAGVYLVRRAPICPLYDGREFAIVRPKNDKRPHVLVREVDPALLEGLARNGRLEITHDFNPPPRPHRGFGRLPQVHLRLI